MFPRIRRRWVWLLALGVLLALILGRATLFPAIARLLITEDPTSSPGWVAILDGGLDQERVVERLRAEERTQVLLIARPPSRLEASGLVLPAVVREQQALEARGVPTSDIHVLLHPARSRWDRARSLGEWLEAHPGAEVAVLCPRFDSRRLRLVVDRVLGPDARRAFLVALPDRRYDETNWWRDKDGVVAMWNGYVSLAYTWLAGEGEGPGPDWDPDAFERALR